jgi:PAS domain S-box-containing protein
VAEDDPELARFLADCLSDDYEVVLVRDGVAALDELRGGDVDLLLTDLAMPGMDGLELVRQVRAEVTLREIPVVMLSASGDASASGLALGADDFVTKPFTVNDLRDRLAANLARAKERSADAAWRRAVMHALRDPLLIFDRDGNVVELNEAFTDLFGYTMADGPFTPPYPWWPTEDEDPEALAAIEHLLEGILRSDDVEAETVMYTADRRSVWVHTSGTSVEQPRKGLSARIRVLRDITRDKQARDRRAAAARVSADFARIDDLATLLGVAEHGFELLFDGGSTIQVTTDRPYLFASGKDVGPQDLHDEVASGLAGEPSADTTSLRTGILLVPQTGGTGARAWVQFPRPRRISLDEMIAADLLAQAFGLAVDRVVALQRSADKQANLQTAVESHRLIGQAVGILVERHKILPGQAFDRLKQASQNRNLKLREVASRVIETGAEPENV